MDNAESESSGEENEDPPIAGSIGYTPNSSQNYSVAPNQPRQPSHLADVLRYSVEASGSNASAASGAGQPLDEERRQFLEATLSSLTVDVIEELRKAINILRRAGNVESEGECKECEDALDTIADYVENLDIANDFHKIGGFCIFKPCLDSPQSSIRWRTADILAKLTQNNPYCQDKVLQEGLLPILLSLLDVDESSQVRIKSLYAISCLVRDHENSLQEFGQLEGYSILLRAMQSGIEKLQTKSAFLISALCWQHQGIKDELSHMGFVEQLIGLLSEGHSTSTEFLLSALVALVTDHPGNQKECRRPELQLQVLLSKIMAGAKGREEVEEEYEYAEKLMEIVFGGDVEEER